MADHEEHGSRKDHGPHSVFHELALELGLARPGPRDFRRCDQRIREDICERLIAEHSLEVSEVSVDVRAGNVRLEGSVPDRRMKHRIEDLSALCPGVRDVENRIRVDPGRSTPYRE